MLATAKEVLATTKEVLATTTEELATARRKVTIARLKFSTAKYQQTTAEHKDAVSEHTKATVEHAIAEHMKTTAEHIKTTAEHKFATALHDLATDCLRLLMHFFHPIQQCAQQVYHTAVPLSPTSSQLHKSCLQSVIDNQLSYVTAFSGAPSTWGSLLRTIDVRPKQPTCLTTSVHRIISACGDVVDVYDTVTGVLQQSLCTPEAVIKIQCSPDGSILFFVHHSSVTMWDIQTGGHIHTFTTQSRIIDIAVSTTFFACGSSDGSVTLWNHLTKKKSKHFQNDGPIVTIHWVSSLELAVMTRSTLSIQDVILGKTFLELPIPGHAWGMVYLEDKGKCDLLVGTSLPNSQEYFFVATRYIQSRVNPPEETQPEKPTSRWFEPWPKWPESSDGKLTQLWESSAHSQQLSSPTVVQKVIACITPTNGVQLFNPSSKDWVNSSPLLGAAVFVSMSNRNLVVQTKDSIQIFSTDVLASGEVHNDTHLSHVYPLGENYIICILQPTRHITLLKLETLQQLHPNNTTPLFRPSPVDQLASVHASVGHGLAAEFGVSKVVEIWQSGTPLPEQTEATEEDAPLHGWSPERTRVIKVYGSPRWELCVKDPKEGITLASLPLEGGDLETGSIYDITFDSETRFHLKINKPGWHVQIPHDITALPSGGYSHTITKGEPVPLSEPRATPPYTLDANCEWVLDAKSRKICWISPGDIRRGNGGHFWAGLSLVMVGGDGAVRKVTFKDPDW